MPEHSSQPIELDRFDPSNHLDMKQDIGYKYVGVVSGGRGFKTKDIWDLGNCCELNQTPTQLVRGRTATSGGDFARSPH